MPIIKLPCPSCQGRGNIRLPGHLNEVLALVRKGHATAGRILPHLKDEVTAGAVSHRLSELYDIGLVDRARRGKYLHYTVKRR